MQEKNRIFQSPDKTPLKQQSNQAKKNSFVQELSDLPVTRTASNRLYALTPSMMNALIHIEESLTNLKKYQEDSIKCSQSLITQSETSIKQTQRIQHQNAKLHKWGKQLYQKIEGRDKTIALCKGSFRKINEQIKKNQKIDIKFIYEMNQAMIRKIQQFYDSQQ